MRLRPHPGPATRREPPPGLAERASPETVEVAERLSGGDFSPESLEAFGRSVASHYAGPRHTDVPGQLLRLSTFAPDAAGHFFGVLAADYDLRPRLAEIGVPTLVIVGRDDWVCPPAASRALASQIPDADLVEIADAGHFGFSEEPEAFQNAIIAFLSTATRQPATRPTHRPDR